MYDDMIIRNFFTDGIDGIPMSDFRKRGAEERSEVIWRAAHGRVERIVSRGYASPPGFWYDQAEEELVLVLQGSAGVRVDDEGILELGSGDWIVIPAHRRHRVEWTSTEPACVWLCVFGEGSAAPKPD